MIEGASSLHEDRQSTLPTFPDLRPDDYRMYYGDLPVPEPDAQPPPGLRDVLPRLPKGPKHTTMVSEYLFRPETIAAPDFDPEPVVELWDLISQARTGRSARGRRPASGRARSDRHLPAQDRFLFDFNERYRQEMGRPLLG